jgi:hypothetical protein
MKIPKFEFFKILDLTLRKTRCEFFFFHIFKNEMKESNTLHISFMMLDTSKDKSMATLESSSIRLFRVGKISAFSL